MAMSQKRVLFWRASKNREEEKLARMANRGFEELKPFEDRRSRGGGEALWSLVDVVGISWIVGGAVFTKGRSMCQIDTVGLAAHQGLLYSVDIGGNLQYAWVEPFRLS